MPPTVLVVEDQEDLAQLLASFLNDQGFASAIALDGATAVEMATREKPDIVLLDIRLPVLDGFEVIEELKRRRIPTRVIMNSGEVLGIGTAIRCIKAGACDFITKPFDGRQMVDAIRRHLLVERTLVTQVSALVPLEEQLMDEAVRLQRENTELGAELAVLRKRAVATDLLSKFLYVLMTSLAVTALVRLEVIPQGLPALLLALVLLVLLLIPIGQLERLSARFFKMSAHIRTK